MQLNREIAGSCDCGDPEDFDPNHFCSDHKHVRSPESILGNLHPNIRAIAEKIFTDSCKDLKWTLLRFQNAEEESAKLNMTTHVFKKMCLEFSCSVFEFFRKMATEVPAFVHIIEAKLNEPANGDLLKNKVHSKCCVRCFQSEEEKLAFVKKLVGVKPELQNKVCTCSTLDLCIQLNPLLNADCKSALLAMLTDLLQSGHFKPCLAISLLANYEKYM